MAQNKVLKVGVPDSAVVFTYTSGSEAMLLRRARDMYQAGGVDCVYSIDGQPLTLEGPALRVAPEDPQQTEEPLQVDVSVEEPIKRDQPPRRRMPTRPVAREPDPDDVVASSFRVTEMQHECIARSLEVTRKTHDLIGDLNNSFANERLALFKISQHERKAEEPGGVDALLGLAKMVFGHLRNRKVK